MCMTTLNGVFLIRVHWLPLLVSSEFSLAEPWLCWARYRPTQDGHVKSAWATLCKTMGGTNASSLATRDGLGLPRASASQRRSLALQC